MIWEYPYFRKPPYSYSDVKHASSRGDHVDSWCWHAYRAFFFSYLALWSPDYAWSSSWKGRITNYYHLRPDVSNMYIPLRAGENPSFDPIHLRSFPLCFPPGNGIPAARSDNRELRWCQKMNFEDWFPTENGRFWVPLFISCYIMTYNIIYIYI